MQGSPLTPLLQNRACEFPRTRLLGGRSLSRIPRAAVDAGAVCGRRAAWKPRFGSLQTLCSRFRWGRLCHSYPSVAAGLMTCVLLLGPLPSDHRGPRRHIPGITPGLGCLGHLTRPWACGKALPAPRAAPRRARGGLPRSRCSCCAAVESHCPPGWRWVNGQSAVGPLVPSARPILGRRGRAAVPARDTPFSPVGDDDGSVVRSWSTHSCSAPGSTPLGSECSPVFAPLRGSAASLYRGGDAFH